MIEWFVAYDMYGSYLGIYPDYDRAFMVAQMHGGFVLTQTEAWQREEEQEDDDDWDDWEDDLKGKRTRKKSTIKKKNGKFGYII